MAMTALPSFLSVLVAFCFLLHLGGANEHGRNLRGKEVGTSAISAPSLSTPSSTTTSETKTRERNTNEIITSCSTADRRALARRSSHDDDDTTEDQWKDMTECLVHQQTNNKLGHFFMHVSKSGGTSMRDTMLSQTKCYSNPMNHGRLPYVVQNPDTNWFKSSRAEGTGLQLPEWPMIEKSRVEGWPCDYYEEDMHKRKRLAVESESVVGFENDYQTKMGGGGGCRKFIKSTIFREPLARIKSHYKHMAGISEGGSKKLMMMPDDSQVFNVDFMVDVFDVISDNYYTRSFVGHGIFEWESNNKTLVQHPEAWNKIFPAANATLHSMDWVILLSSGQDSEGDDRDLILQNGMGLGPTVSFLHNNTRHGKTEFSLSNEQRLKDMNALDYKLWEEALELHRLDVLSLKRMKPYYAAAVVATKEERSDHCCGLVCWIYDDDVES